MRNLKKILALVLALVMVVGMMGIASAATPGTGYADDAAITTYDESIQILTALGIYEGDENAAFNPEATITRAEVATLIYRVVTQDTAGKYVKLYTDYNQFADVPADAWYAGYVNFCANAGYILGDGTNFYPMEKVTGYQVLAIMLRVIGYGMEGEFQGTNWHIRTASKAAELGVTATIVPGTLGSYSTRAMVAELIYRALGQTSTVSYNHITYYNETGYTYGYLHFGLTGDVSQVENSKAVIDGIYDEPVSFWTWNGGTIAIRYNPVAKYTVAVKDSALYAKVGGRGEYVTAYNYSIDGYVVGTPNLYVKDTAETRTVFGGKGVETIVFVADGRIFIVEKNTYVDFADNTLIHTLNEGTMLESKHKELVGFWANYFGIQNDACTAKLASTIPYGSTIIFNSYNGLVDTASIHVAKSQNVVVTNTYDTNNNATSYFIAGQKYEYNDIYATGAGWNLLPQVILNRDEETVDVQIDWTVSVTDKFDAKQTIYFDDFGYVIFTHDTMTSTTASEKGYVFVRSAAYGGQVADNRWVSNYTVIMPNGTATTIKGATNENGYWTTQKLASDADFDLGLYAYEIKGGYYCLYKVDATEDSHIVANRIDDAGLMTDTMYAGDADCFGSDYLVDDGTTYIVANYDATGAISGYSVIKGFKNIPDLKGDKYIEVVANTKDGTIELVLVLGATQSADVAGPETKDQIVYLADVTPEDYVNTYDSHKVITNGTAGTMKFVNNTVYNSNTGTVNYGLGFYTISGVQYGTNYVSALAPVSTVSGYVAAEGVLAVGADYVAIAENCAFYLISGASVESISEADLADLGTVELVVAATNAYGFATVVYVK